RPDDHATQFHDPTPGGRTAEPRRARRSDTEEHIEGGRKRSALSFAPRHSPGPTRPRGSGGAALGQVTPPPLRHATTPATASFAPGHPPAPTRPGGAGGAGLDQVPP